MIRGARFVSRSSLIFSPAALPWNSAPFTSSVSLWSRTYTTPGKKSVKVNLTTEDGTKLDFECPCNSEHSLMNAIRDVAKLNMMGMCDGCLECGTCHAVLSEKWFKKVPPPSSKEQDLLDQLDDVQPTSRLCCQVKMIEEIDGIEVLMTKT